MPLNAFSLVTSQLHGVAILDSKSHLCISSIHSQGFIQKKQFGGEELLIIHEIRLSYQLFMRRYLVMFY